MGDERWQLIGFRKEGSKGEGEPLCSLTEASVNTRCVCTQIGPGVAFMIYILRIGILGVSVRTVHLYFYAK